MNTVNSVTATQYTANSIGQIILNDSFLQKVIALPTTTTLPPAARTSYSKGVDQCLSVLCKNYELYLGYIELEFEEDAAREKADLADDMKYTLAYYAWQQNDLNA
jgi:hypothetical protein